MRNDFLLNHFRFHLEAKVPLHIPAHNKGNVIRGGFGSTFRRIGNKKRVRDRESCSWAEDFGERNCSENISKSRGDRTREPERKDRTAEKTAGTD